MARRGYRFAAPVSVTPGAPAVAAAAPAAPAVRKRRWEWVAGVVVLLLGAILISTQRRTTSATGAFNIRVVPLTANPGMELQPAFFPDGTRIAYAWNGMDAGPFAIYTKLIGAGDPVRITRDVARDFSPAWSPDGRWVAALRDFGQENAVILIPATGGQPRELSRVRKAQPEAGTCAQLGGPHVRGFNYWGPSLSWSPDGRYLLTSAYSAPDSPRAIIRISSDTGAQFQLTSPPMGTEGDFGGAVSPDGRNLAFARMVGAKTGDLYVASLSDATPIDSHPRKIASDNADIEAFAWTADARELIFSSDRGGRRELWRIGISDSGMPLRLAGEGGKRMVYGRGTNTGSLWKIPIDGTTEARPVRVTASTARDKFSHISPDGKRIAFQSARSGVDEIWWCDADGGNATQLTSFGKGLSGSPRWSPDGQSIAFDSNVGGNWDIYVIVVTGGTARRLTSSTLNDSISNWSRDGRWIYFNSCRAGRSEVWKIRPDGSSETQVTRNGGSIARESVDGRSLYYRVGSGPGDLWKTPVEGGPSVKVLSSVNGRIFTVTTRGIYYSVADPAMQLRFLDFETHSIRSIAPLSFFGHAVFRRTSVG